MPSFADLTDQSNEAQIERDKQRLNILEAEYKEGGEVDQSLAGDIEKLKRTGGGYGSFPKEAGMKIDTKFLSTDFKKVLGIIEEDSKGPINIGAIKTKITSSDKLPSKKEIDKMSFYEVNKLREKYKGDEKAQELLGSREHFLFMEDIIKKNPEAAIGAAAATIGYQAIKTTDIGRELVKTTEEKASQASLEQLKGGLGGIVSGLSLYATESMLKMLGIETKKE